MGGASRGVGRGEDSLVREFISQRYREAVTGPMREFDRRAGAVRLGIGGEVTLASATGCVWAGCLTFLSNLPL